MEVNYIFFNQNEELIKKALEQAMASVLLEFNDLENILEKEEGKILVLKGRNNGWVGRLFN